MIRIEARELRKRPRGRLLGTAAALATVVAMTACSGAGAPEGEPSDADGADTVKVALLYYGNGQNEYDAIWREAVTAALDKVYPDAYELQEVADVPATEQLTQTIEQVFAQGADIMIENVAGGELTNTACERHLDKICAPYYPQPLDGLAENMFGFYMEAWNSYFLQGVAAGMLTDSNVVGWVGPFQINFITMHSNALALGCQSVNPDCVVKETLINSFLDPVAARAAGKALIDDGADVLLGFHDDPTLLNVAEEEGVWSFGLYRSLSEYGGDTYVNSWLVGPVIEEHVTNVLEAYSEGRTLDEGLSTYPTPFDGFGPNVPVEVQDAFEALQAEMDAGKWVFEGPIYGADGELHVPEGQALDEKIAYDEWNWYVKGHQGSE